MSTIIVARWWEDHYRSPRTVGPRTYLAYCHVQNGKAAKCIWSPVKTAALRFNRKDAERLLAMLQASPFLSTESYKLQDVNKAATSACTEIKKKANLSFDTEGTTGKVKQVCWE